MISRTLTFILCTIGIFLLSMVTSHLLTLVLGYCATWYFDAWDLDGPGIGLGLLIFFLGNVLVHFYVGMRFYISWLSRQSDPSRSGETTLN